MLRPLRIFETVLYARQLDAMRSFYRDVMGLRLVRDWGDAGLVFRLDDQTMLLIFDPDHSSRPGRPVPSHGATGSGHVAFRIDAADCAGWLARLADYGIPVEHEHHWSESDGWNRGDSIYIRDPAGNSVELITADIWPDRAEPVG